MSAIILHISDIHIKNQNDPILKQSENIAKCLYQYLPQANKVFIIVSGDIAYSGKQNEYELAKGFLRSLKVNIQQEKNCDVVFVLVPGNHDCDFSSDNKVRQALIKVIEESEKPEVDKDIIEACISVQKNYVSFRDDMEDGNNVENDSLWRTVYSEVDDRTISFECLNVSWMSKLHEEPGKIFFPVDLYQHKRESDVDVRFLVMHHPFNWFNQSVYRNFRKFIRSTADIIVTGHEHQGNVGIVFDAETDKSAFIEGWVLQGHSGLADSSFNVVIVNLKESQFLSESYRWSDKGYTKIEEGSWSNFHELQIVRSGNPFEISKIFQEVLDDPGAVFKNAGKQKISLPDIYVYPDLLKVNPNLDAKRNLISSTKLLSVETIGRGVLLEGNEKTGTTSLLYQLYREYHDKGYVCVLLDGKSLKKRHDKDVQGYIEKAITFQYGSSFVEVFEQVPKSKKIVLIDDFDDCPQKMADARSDILNFINARFGTVIVTVGEMFDMRELFDGVATPQAISSLSHYKIQPFGYALRSKLIEKWFLLGADGSIDRTQLISQCDQAEKVMDAVMAKTVIPTLPLYLLTLLQSIEAGRSGDFKESALGYYYQYLLTDAFKNAGVKSEKLTEIFEYSSHLAWYFHGFSKSELSEQELNDFNRKFSRDWTTVDFKERLDELINAKVLFKSGDDYSFRYPYIYYFLKGKFISDNLSDLDIRAYVCKCCKHLYVREYANTILFLVHHTNDEFVLNSVADSLRGLFRKYAPVTFNTDTQPIGELIKIAPELTYTGESPEAHRQKRSEIKDEFDNGDDGLAAYEEKSDELSLFAELTTLFKSNEILGQVLKNQYSKIRRPKKVDLLEELFNGPLRALRSFYEFIEKNPDAIVLEIESAIERKGAGKDRDERRKVAQKVAADLIQIVSYGFIAKAAYGANSDSLSEDVYSVVKKNDTLAFNLIQLAILLDSPKDLPRSKLKQIITDVDKDFIAKRLLQLLVLNRLYMFKTSEKDMQWLNSELKLDLGQQHVIAYNKNKQKLL